MTSPHRHISASELIGSWPVVPHPTDGYSKSYLLTGTIMESAKILGMRTDSSGFDVHNKSLALYVNGAFTQVDFNDYGPGLYSIDQVVANINGDVGSTVAYADNGFLLLKSPTSGDGSSLKVQSITGYEELPAELGLLSGTEVFAGELEKATHLDPTRQVATPGQLAALWGEPLTADHFNRIAMQLATSVDDSHNLFYKRRTAQKKVYETTLAGVPSFQLATSDMVYMGPDAAPTANQLEEVIAILDENDDEIVVESENIANTTTGTVTFAIEADTESQLVTFNSLSPFQSTDPAGDWYVRVQGLAGGASALNGVLLKILEFRSSSQVVVHPVVPSTGQVIKSDQTTASATQQRVQIITEKARVEGFYSDAGLTQRAEQVNAARQGPLAVTRIERNNRIYCATGDFVAQGVIVGDLVSWDAAGASSPYTNQGTYRVSAVVDAKTLELCAEDFSSALLNPVGPVHGNVTITSDGDFLSQPYVKFVNPDAVPNGNVRIHYLGSSTLKEAMDDVATFAGSVRHAQEAEANLQKAIIGLAGPSMDSLADVLSWVYGDRRNNLENTIVQLQNEHHNDDTGGGGGRHSDIRPDTLDMFPGISGATGIFRNASGEDTSTIVKMGLRDSADAGYQFSVNGQGNVSIGDLAGGATDLYISRTTRRAQFGIETSGVGNYTDVFFYSANADAWVDIWGGGTGATAAVYLGTNTGYWSIETFEGNARKALEFNIPGQHETLVLDGLNGYVGIGTSVPSSLLTLKARSSSDDDMLELRGNNDTQDIIRMIFRPRGNTGSQVGWIQAYDDGAGPDEPAFSIQAFNELYLGSNLSMYFRPGFMDAWYMHWFSGHLLPMTTSMDIGATGEEVRHFYGYQATIGGGSSDYHTLFRPKNVDKGLSVVGWSYAAVGYAGPFGTGTPGDEFTVMTLGVQGTSGVSPLNYLVSEEALTIRTDNPDNSLYLQAASLLELRSGADGSSGIKYMNFRVAGTIRWRIEEDGDLVPVTTGLDLGSSGAPLADGYFSGAVSIVPDGMLVLGGTAGALEGGVYYTEAIDVLSVQQQAGAAFLFTPATFQPPGDLNRDLGTSSLRWIGVYGGRGVFNDTALKHPSSLLELQARVARNQVLAAARVYWNTSEWSLVEAATIFNVSGLGPSTPYNNASYVEVDLDYPVDLKSAVLVTSLPAGASYNSPNSDVYSAHLIQGGAAAGYADRVVVRSTATGSTHEFMMVVIGSSVI